MPTVLPHPIYAAYVDRADEPHKDRLAQGRRGSGLPSRTSIDTYLPLAGCEQDVGVFPKLGHSLLEPVLDGHTGFPAEGGAGEGDVGLAHGGVVDRAVDESDGRRRPGQVPGCLGQSEDAQLVGVADIDRARQIRAQQAHEPFDQVVDVADGAGLRPVAGDGQRLPAQGLADERRDRPTVVGAHTGGRKC